MAVSDVRSVQPSLPSLSWPTGCGMIHAAPREHGMLCTFQMRKAGNLPVLPPSCSPAFCRLTHTHSCKACHDCSHCSGVRLLLLDRCDKTGFQSGRLPDVASVKTYHCDITGLARIPTGNHDIKSHVLDSQMGHSLCLEFLQDMISHFDIRCL